MRSQNSSHPSGYNLDKLPDNECVLPIAWADESPMAATTAVLPCMHGSTSLLYVQRGQGAANVQVAASPLSAA
jgi:hypothetical protein